MKTYKREVATGMLCFALVLGAYATVSVGALEVLKILSPPIFLFAGGAFGMDAYSKQIRKA